VEIFKTQCQNELERIIAVQAAWLDAASHGIEVPYNAVRGGDYNNVAVYSIVEDEEARTSESVFDEEATRKEFARVVKWARSKKYAVRKDYTYDDFNIYVKISDDLELNFYSTRKAVCTKRVVGTKVIPATTREIVEWDCDRIAFTDLATD
jgi:hypothetical protein